MGYITLTPEKAQEILYGDSNEGKIIRDTISGHGRWTVNHDLIFELRGKLYHVKYRTGATEYQDESPFEFDDEVKCQEVKAVQKTITDYEPV